jgi:uncharacterized phage protein (TIGR02218 family)
MLNPKDIWSYYAFDPVTELYKFQHGTQFFAYAATSEKEYRLENLVYTPEYIWRTAMHYSSDFAKDTLSVTLPAKNAVARLFMAGTPEHLLKLTIYRGGYHAGNFSPIWLGSVNGANFTFDDQNFSCELSCETAVSRMERRGLARCYQLTCPHTLYSAACRASLPSFAHTATVMAVDGISISLSSSFADGYFAGGQARTQDGKRRYVASSTGASITLDRAMPMNVGTVLTLYAGCDKTRATCQNKFNNVANFGGFPWLPVEDPFRSSIG